MKNILFVIYTFSYGGGAEKLLANIVNKLDSTKYNIDIMEIENCGKFEKTNSNIVIKKSIINEKYIGKLKKKILFLLIKFYPKLIRNKFLDKKYDLEIAFNYKLPSYIISYSMKNICWIHGPIDDLNYKNIKKPLKKIMTYYYYLRQKKSFDRSSKIITISEISKKSIIDLYDIPESKIKVLYNGLDLNYITTMSKNKKIDTSKFTIVSVGRIDENKNQQLLIQAANILKNNGEKFEILIIGQGNEEDKLKQLVNELGLEDYIKFIGYQNNPYPYIKAADLMCLTSKLEGFGNVIIESMHLKTPVISTRTGIAHELFDQYDCGLLINNCPEDLVKAIYLIKNDSKIRQKIIENAYRISLNFDESKYINEIENIIDIYIGGQQCE